MRPPTKDIIMNPKHAHLLPKYDQQIADLKVLKNEMATNHSEELKQRYETKLAENKQLWRKMRAY